MIQAESPLEADDSRAVIASKIEIERGELAQVLCDAAKDRVEYIFGIHITSFKEHTGGVDVQFDGSASPKRFDLLVAAEGLGSAVRTKMLDGAFDRAKHTRSLNAITAYHTIPRLPGGETGGAGTARQAAAPSAFGLGFATADRVAAYTSVIGSDERAATELAGADLATQKRQPRTLFENVGWQTERLLDGVDNATDFLRAAHRAVASAALVVRAGRPSGGGGGRRVLSAHGHGTTVAARVTSADHLSLGEKLKYAPHALDPRASLVQSSKSTSLIFCISTCLVSDFPILWR